MRFSAFKSYHLTLQMLQICSKVTKFKHPGQTKAPSVSQRFRANLRHSNCQQMSVARICPTTNLKTIFAGHSPILREKRLKTLKLNIKHPFASDCIHQLLKTWNTINHFATRKLCWTKSWTPVKLQQSQKAFQRVRDWSQTNQHQICGRHLQLHICTTNEFPPQRSTDISGEGFLAAIPEMTQAPLIGDGALTTQKSGKFWDGWGYHNISK